MENSKIYLLNEERGFLIDEFWGLFGTLDGCNNWQCQKFSIPLADIFFIDENIGFIAGGYCRCAIHGDGSCSCYGMIFLSDDGGKTWIKILNSVSRPESFQFINHETGYLLFSHPEGPADILKTTDGGKNWYNIYGNWQGYFDLESRIMFYDQYFLNEDEGWIIGSYVEPDSHGASIFHSLSGGTSWEMVWKSKAYETLNDLYFTQSTGWAVGENGLIVRYTKEGQWQIVPDLTDLPLTNVFFSDEQHGWISGGYFNKHDFQSFLFRTCDGGQSWTNYQFDKYLVNDLFFTDSLHGWVVGIDTTSLEIGLRGVRDGGYGVILFTKNGGKTWEVQVDDAHGYPNALFFRDGICWVVGDGGLVLRTEDGSTWIDQRKGETYLSSFQLKQNYPNPFNPITNIQFSITKSEFISLKIFNLLGQEVATLVSEKLKPGTYTYTWDATGFASGLYYYQIKSSEFQKVKKMIMIK